MSKISIVIPVFNKFNFTKSALDDLTKLKDCEIIVVDNASTDETEEELKKYSIVYIRNQENLGFAKACNIGFAKASSNYVLFLNNDIRVKFDFENWTDTLINSPYISGPTMGLLDKDFSFVKEENKMLVGNFYLSGWCIGAKKEIWKQLDLSTNEIFSEDFFCYFEDADLSFRAKKKKIPLNIVEVPVVHFGKTSSKQLNVAMLYQKAKAIFVRKWSKK